MHQLTFAYIGRQRGKQNYICVPCGRQFIDSYESKGYSEEFKLECLEMYVNGCGFRAIERVKKVHHTTIINWVKEVGITLPDVTVQGVQRRHKTPPC